MAVGNRIATFGLEENAQWAIGECVDDDRDPFADKVPAADLVRPCGEIM
jgi:hypothetical protein